MGESAQVRDFLLQLERTLTTRKLYAPAMAPYQEATETLFQKYREAVGGEGFTLRVGPSDLFLGKASLFNRDKREDSFFFPLFRDGLREISFSPLASPRDLEELLSVFEAERKGLLGPSQDAISFMWRLDLRGVHFKAIDGIGDQEGEDGASGSGDQYRALVADLVSKIQNLAPPTTGQSYDFLLDADTRVAATDLHYEATTTRRAFEENPTVLTLTTEEVAKLRGEIGAETDLELLKRFIEIMFVALLDPTAAVLGENLACVFQQILEGYWNAADYEQVSSLLNRLNAVSQVAPVPESREATRKIVLDFLTPERLGKTFDLAQSARLPLSEAAVLWTFAGDTLWESLVDFWWTLPRGELRSQLETYLRNRLSVNSSLLGGTLRASQPDRLRAGLALIQDGLEALYAKELLALTGHSEEHIRLKALAAVGRVGDRAALEALWKAMESDPAKTVRLLAFRLVARLDLPELPLRLRSIVTHTEFAQRPAWEREKYVRLLGAVGGESARQLFQSWIPQKRWLWQRKDHEAAQLALWGLAAGGASGREMVQSLAAGRGKLAAIAHEVLRNDSPGLEHQQGTRRS